MAVNEEYVQYILGQLSEFDNNINYKKMFGGIGFFKDSLMFALITSQQEFMLKTDESNVEDFKGRGMTPFSFKGKVGPMPYYLVPEEVTEQAEELKEWARKAFDVAVKKKKV
jgi:DNA transformation protein and related proteins